MRTPISEVPRRSFATLCLEQGRKEAGTDLHRLSLMGMLNPKGYPRFSASSSSPSPPKGATQRSGSRGMAAGTSWSQVVRGGCKFWWKTSKTTDARVEALEARFNQLVVFSAKELHQSTRHWKNALIARMGFARMAVTIDITKPICPGAQVKLADTIIWQQFTYEELPEMCYACGKLAAPSPSCQCSSATMIEAKPLYGPWIRAARVQIAVNPMEHRSSPAYSSINEQQQFGWTVPKKISKEMSPSNGQGMQDSTLIQTGSRYDPLATNPHEQQPDTQQMEISIVPLMPPLKEKKKRSPPKLQKDDSSPGSESPPRRKFVIENTEIESPDKPKLSAVGIHSRHKASSGQTQKMMWRPIDHPAEGSEVNQLSAGDKESLHDNYGTIPTSHTTYVVQLKANLDPQASQLSDSITCVDMLETIDSPNPPNGNRLTSREDGRLLTHSLQ
ncbi:hypothetical protein COCNU_07G001620 [Cocos nucifera]|uniref:Uncharacterized protein n=1 Tax=Cocos nucifera TaxID=13894 RepID=A0A8K0N3W1_COCNU|nr:hypothetical protein COCNU_07G001620 [Cocos nucifera]